MDGFYLIPFDRIEEFWDLIFPILSEACEYNGNLDKPEDTYNLLIKNHKHLWLNLKDGKIILLVITSFEKYSLKKVLSIDICTGDDLDSSIENLSILENFAKENDCAKMFMMARIGYERKLKKYNYRKTHIFLEKDLL